MKISDELSQNKDIKELQKHVNTRMKRLLTKTGEGTKIINWDLSQGNKTTLVDWSKNEQTDEYIINQDIDLTIKFPADFSVKEKATMIICRKKDATAQHIKAITISLPRGTTDKAYQIDKNSSLFGN